MRWAILAFLSLWVNGNTPLGWWEGEVADTREWSYNGNRIQILRLAAEMRATESGGMILSASLHAWVDTWLLEPLGERTNARLPSLEPEYFTKTENDPVMPLRPRVTFVDDSRAAAVENSLFAAGVWAGLAAALGVLAAERLPWPTMRAMVRRRRFARRWRRQLRLAQRG